MTNLSKLIFTLIVVLSPFTIKAADIQFSILNTAKREFEPGATINLISKFVNHTSEDALVEVKILDPLALVRPIVNYSSLAIPKNTSSNRVLGILVPSNCDAGNYSIEIEAIDKHTQQSIGKIKIEFVVKTRYEIELIKLNAPAFLYAGDTVSFRSIVQNRSNTTVKVKTTTIEGARSKTEIVTIPKDSSLQLNYFTTISKKSTTYSKEFLFTTAQIVDQEGSDKHVSYEFDVFPNKQVKFDRYNRFPIKIGSMAYVTNRWGDWRAVTMFDVYGSGNLGKNKDKTLSFNLRGPDRRGNPLLGLEDSYNLKFKSKHFDLSLGDDNYSLTQLTESSRNGRGVKAAVSLNKLTIGGFYNAPRYYPLIKNTTSFYSVYDFNTNNYIKLGALFKKDTTSINTEVYTISANNKPFSWLRTDIEVALGRNALGIGKSYNGTFSINKKGFATYGNYVFADPNFPGYLSNSTRIDLGTSLNIKRISFNCAYSVNKTNIALDTLFSNMPYTKNINITTGYRLFNTSILSIGGYMIEALDRSPIPLFNYTKYSGRLSLQSSIKLFSMSLQGDYNKLFNWMNELNRYSNTYAGSLNLGYHPGSIFTGNAYITYQGGEQGITGYDLFYYGSSFEANLNEKFLIRAQYNSNFEWQYYTSERSLLSLTLRAQLNANHQIDLLTNYNLKKNSLNTKELNVQLRYIYTLNVPISKRKDAGSLTGKINNHGIDKVSGIRLKIDGNVAITDKEGNFRFPGLPVGTHLLTIDASSLGINTITEIPGPYTIEIKPATTSHFEFAMTKAAQINGKLVIEEDSRANEKGYIPIKEEIERLVIEASNNNEVYRVYTDRYSCFSFSDLRPGDWVVKIYTNALPRGYKIESTRFSFTLKPGENHSIEVNVKKVARQVRFQTINKDKQK